MVAALAAFWLACASAEMVVAPPYPVASPTSTSKIIDEVDGVGAGIQDERLFAAELAQDRFRAVPADRLLRGLRDKQVVIVFVESYGRVALEQPTSLRR